MAAFLHSIGYHSWVLPSLLIIPLIGALVVGLHGRTLRGASDEAIEAGATTARQLTFGILLLEFVVSAGLWWSFDPTTAAFQATIDWPWIDSSPWGSMVSR
jgi:NADH:ubiquinone oxidoreductase subunit 4 (subunit M)